MFEDIFVVSKRLALATNEQVDRLERGICVSLPRGYREYVCQLGEGEFSDNLRVYSPDIVLGQLEEFRSVQAEGFQSSFLNWREQPIGQSDVDHCVELASTANGDSIIICPDYPGKMFVLPRHSDQVQVIEGGFEQPERVVRACFMGRWEREFQFFEPYTSLRECFGYGYGTFCSTSAVASEFEERYSGARIYREQIGDGPGSYLRIFVEALTAKVNISRNDENNTISLFITLDVDRAPELESFLSDASKRLGMAKRE